MKKFILLALTTLIMVGCLSKRDSNGIPYDVYVIDSCEYIDGGHAYGIGHKGNCRFCKERRQKEMKELVEQLKEK
jgi:hypothetical protein